MIEEVYGHLLPDYTAEQMAKLRITPEPALKIANKDGEHNCGGSTDASKNKRVS